MVTDFPNDVPKALQHPGMLSESLRENSAVFSLVLMGSDTYLVFPKNGVKGNSHVNYPNVGEKQDTCLWDDSTSGHFSHFRAPAHPRQSMCIYSALLRAVMLGVCSRGVRLAFFFFFFWCILFPLLDCRVLKGEEHFSCFVFHTCLLMTVITQELNPGGC